MDYPICANHMKADPKNLQEIKVGTFNIKLFLRNIPVNLKRNEREFFYFVVISSDIFGSGEWVRHSCLCKANKLSS